MEGNPMGRKPIGAKPMTDKERQDRHRAARAAEKPFVRIRGLKDQRRRPQQWADACDTLLSVLDDYQAWRDAMPPALADTTTAERLDAVLELRDLVEQLQGAELPKGFGRD
jgi:hypothetical protein